jgi:hypothetical protein
MARKEEKKTHRVTLHGAESYSAGKEKFLRGKARNVTEKTAMSLPAHKFSITEIEPVKPEEEEAH